MMRNLKVWLFAGLLSLLSPQPVQAVATTAVTINNTTWTDLGVGPIQISASTAISYAISDLSPTIPLATGYKLAANTTQPVNTTSHVWAMTVSVSSASVFVAPITSGGGGGGGAVTQASGSISPGASPDIGQGGAAAVPYDGLPTPSGTINLQNSALSIYEAALKAIFFANNSHAVTSSLASSLQVITSPATLMGFYCNGIQGGAPGYCIAVNSNTAPTAGPLTNVLDNCYFNSPAGCPFSRVPIGISASNGIFIVISSAASPLIYTTGTLTGFISADFHP